MFSRGVVGPQSLAFLDVPSKNLHLLLVFLLHFSLEIALNKLNKNKNSFSEAGFWVVLKAVLRQLSLFKGFTCGLECFQKTTKTTLETGLQKGFPNKGSLKIAFQKGWESFKKA